jgi:hypothetical protein
LVALRSSGVADAPERSSTVKAIADGALAVTVTLPAVGIDAALAKYQISPSACEPEATATTLVQDSPSESDTLVTVGSALVFRSRMAATRVSPAVVGDLGDAEREVAATELKAPNVPDSVIDALASAGKCCRKLLWMSRKTAATIPHATRRVARVPLGLSVIPLTP